MSYNTLLILALYIAGRSQGPGPGPDPKDDLGGPVADPGQGQSHLADARTASAVQGVARVDPG